MAKPFIEFYHKMPDHALTRLGIVDAAGNHYTVGLANGFAGYQSDPKDEDGQRTLAALRTITRNSSEDIPTLARMAAKEYTSAMGLSLAKAGLRWSENGKIATQVKGRAVVIEDTDHNGIPDKASVDCAQVRDESLRPNPQCRFYIEGEAHPFMQALAKKIRPPLAK